ncbi:actin-like ATPase domain-containing protein [Aspergillus tubingensis]|uniref:actin-like ATPase domain-containing protein n=1 Tax=Aspergillus tubingensis TaxID=5068 RepID=UPI001578C440|nr:actin-like ATPase domain-containing protein [Aspergillus tubingensis]GFN16477.1 actin-like ATPase domain-containing protein [Aspergillus tubingensis]
MLGLLFISVSHGFFSSYPSPHTASGCRSSLSTKSIVGIDFGTEKTCASHALWNSIQKKPPPIFSLTISDRIVFSSCLALGQDERILWGQEAYDGQQGTVYKWLKIFLYDPDHPILQEPNAPQLPEGVLPEELVTVYLRQLYDAITEKTRTLYPNCDEGTDYWFGWPATWSNESQQKMMRAVQDAGYGNGPEELVTVYLRQLYDAITEKTRTLYPNCDEGTDYWFGWPATWSNESQQKMMRAVQDAGYGNGPDRFFFVTEAEAVALFFTYHEHYRKVSNDCGLAAMDAALRGYVRSLPGVPSQRFLDKIGDLKRGFNGDEVRPIVLPASGQRTALPKHIKGCLNPTIEKILSLILENIDASRQMQRPISHVLLAGGGGMMPYLRSHIGVKLEGIAEVLYLIEYAAIPRLQFDRSYGLEATSEAIVHEEGLDRRILRKTSIPYWIGQEYAIDHEESHIFNIFHRAGDPATTIINLVEHPGKCPSPDDGTHIANEIVTLVPKGVFEFCLQLQDRDSILRTGDECSIKVQIAWTLRYSKQQAEVELVASVKDAELGRKVGILDGHRLVH